MWEIANTTLSNRLLMGTSQYPSLEILTQAIVAAKTQVITLSLKRVKSPQQENLFWQHLQALSCHILPNTAGCRSAQQAIMLAQMARELFNTNWIKLEIFGDDYTLQPDPLELIKAATLLVKEGFEVFPYTSEDLVVAKYLRDAGCRIIMPAGSPIGSAKGILNPYALTTLRTHLPDVQLIVDAGLGKPSQAAQAMELGMDGVLVNTAIANAIDPIKMAIAFNQAVQAGRNGFEAGLVTEQETTTPSTPLIDSLFWHQQ